MRDSSFEIRYVGTRSLDLPVQMRLNSASAFNPQTGVAPLAPLPTYINASDIPGAVPAPVDTVANFDAFCSNAAVTSCQPLSSAGFLGSMTTFPPVGNGIYHAVSGDFIHRFAKGLYCPRELHLLEKYR